jgi:hypothetical protein
MGVLLHQFQIDAGIRNYVFRSGVTAVFNLGIYRTNVQSEIDELNEQIAAGLRSIWVPKDGATVDSDDIDPEAVMRRKIIAEYEASKARVNAPSVSSSEGTLKPLGTSGENHAVSNSGAAQTIPVSALPPLASKK